MKRPRLNKLTMPKLAQVTKNITFTPLPEKPHNGLSAERAKNQWAATLKSIRKKLNDVRIKRHKETVRELYFKAQDHQEKVRKTVKKPDSFPVFFSECSSHWAQVIVHPTLRSIRRALKGVNISDGMGVEGLEAATIVHRDKKDSLLATIHLCREALECSHICHEAMHAAWHRAKILGIQDEDDFQEFVAYGQAHLLTQIADWLQENCQT